jgi:short subunit dehydrogenase-like uncharacterized protein
MVSVLTMKKYQIIVFGATGFVGKRFIQYISHRAEFGLRHWAISGRDPKKLDRVYRTLHPSNRPEKQVANLEDTRRIDELISESEIVINLAGPFFQNGPNIVESCVRHKTHYLDISGEVNFGKKIIKSSHSKAVENGTCIIPFAGFDSVPADFGSFYMMEKIHQFVGEKTKQVEIVYNIGGGLNGGTFLTALGLGKNQNYMEAHSPYNLCVDSFDIADEYCEEEDKAHFHKNYGKWVAPFFQRSINTNVVQRSVELLSKDHQYFKLPFYYNEYWNPTNSFNKVSAKGVSWAQKLADFAFQKKALHPLLKRFGPKSGEGPSDLSIERGHFAAHIFAITESGSLFKAQMKSSGDPSNKSTVKLLAASLHCMIKNKNSLPGGVRTAASAFKMDLYDSLKSQNISITVPTLCHK